MSDLVERLRAAGPRTNRQCGAMSGAGYRCKLDYPHHVQDHDWDRGPWPDYPALCAEAADEIERLAAAPAKVEVHAFCAECGWDLGVTGEYVSSALVMDSYELIAFWTQIHDRAGDCRRNISVEQRSVTP